MPDESDYPTLSIPPGAVIRVEGGQLSWVTEPQSSTVDVEAFPTTWVRTGQTAFHIYVRHERRYVQIVGVTDRVETREWVRHPGRAELGGRRSFSREEFLREWGPYYNENQTTVGSRFLRLETQEVFLVIQSIDDRFAVRSTERFDSHFTLHRQTSPEEWLYIGPPIVQPEPRRHTRFDPISFTRPLTPPTGITEPVMPRSRFDRDDII